MSRAGGGPKNPFPYVTPYAGMPRGVSQVPGNRPPGSPSTADGPPRLPGLGGYHAYDPPTPAANLVEQQSPILGQASDYESKSIQVPWLDAGISPGKQVFTAARRWRACDVYIDLEGFAPPVNAIFTVLVFAVSSFGARTIVASGRVGRFGFGPTFPNQRPFWVCAARAVAERYEVTVFYASNAGGGSNGETFTVTTVCTDEMVQPPPFIGCMLGSATVSSGLIAIGGASDGAPFPELCMVQASIDVATPTWIHFHDRTVVSPVGLSPQMVWGVGSASGEGVVDDTIRYRCQTNGFLLALSSTLGATALLPPGAGVLQCLWR